MKQLLQPECKILKVTKDVCLIEFGNSGTKLKAIADFGFGDIITTSGDLVCFFFDKKNRLNSMELTGDGKACLT
jgi:hypothetical protein